MEVIEICRMVARSLISEIGPWGNRCALFGGLSPGLLVPVPTAPLLPHIGTRDIDLAIGVAASGSEPLKISRSSWSCLCRSQPPSKGERYSVNPSKRAAALLRR